VGVPLRSYASNVLLPNKKTANNDYWCPFWMSNVRRTTRSISRLAAIGVVRGSLLLNVAWWYSLVRIKPFLRKYAKLLRFRLTQSMSVCYVGEMVSMVECLRIYAKIEQCVFTQTYNGIHDLGFTKTYEWNVKLERVQRNINVHFCVITHCLMIAYLRKVHPTCSYTENVMFGLCFCVNTHYEVFDRLKCGSFRSNLSIA
jgi:hypothetical protein